VVAGGVKFGHLFLEEGQLAGIPEGGLWVRAGSNLAICFWRRASSREYLKGECGCGRGQICPSVSGGGPARGNT
jgi:hypothetical protein